LEALQRLSLQASGVCRGDSAIIITFKDVVHPSLPRPSELSTILKDTYILASPLRGALHQDSFYLHLSYSGKALKASHKPLFTSPIIIGLHQLLPQLNFEVLSLQSVNMDTAEKRQVYPNAENLPQYRLTLFLHQWPISSERQKQE
jgi:hypothetical protein